MSGKKLLSIFKGGSSRKSSDKGEQTTPRRRHTSTSIENEAVIEGLSEKLGIVIVFGGTGATKTLEIHSWQFAPVEMTQLVCEQYELSPLSSLSFEAEVPVSGVRQTLSSVADFRGFLSTHKAVAPFKLFVRTKKGRSNSDDAGGSGSPVPVLQMGGASFDKRIRRKSGSHDNHSNVLDMFAEQKVEESAEKGSKTIKVQATKKAPVSPRPVDKVFSDAPSSGGRKHRKGSDSSKSKIPDSKLESSSDDIGGSSGKIPKARRKKEGDGSSGRKSKSKSIGKAEGRHEGRQRSSSVSADVAPSFEDLSREELLLALKSDGGEKLPSAVLASVPSPKTGRPPMSRKKSGGEKTTGRSVEDFAKILGADSSVNETGDMTPPSAIKKTTKSRPHSMLIRGMSTMSISSAAPKIQELRKPPRKLVHQTSLQEMTRPSPPRSSSGIKAGAGASVVEKSRDEVIADLRKQALELEKTFPKQELGTFFSERQKKFQRELQREKRKKYAMMMPVISVSGLAEVGRMESPNRSSTSKAEVSVSTKKSSSNSSKGLSNIVNDLCKALTGAPEDEGHLENARALAQFSPKLEGGCSTLIVELWRCYKDSASQAGSFIVCTVLVAASKLFEKDRRSKVEELLQEFASKDMTAIHRHSLFNKSSMAASPLVSRKQSSSQRDKSFSRKFFSGSQGAVGKSLDFGDLDMKQLADAVTVIDYENLTRIPVEDFLYHRWEAGKREVEGGKNTKIFTCVLRWVFLGDWVATEIVSTASYKQRVLVMRRMVDLASELWMRGNFQSSMAIVSALQSASVARLKETWKGLSSTSTKKFELLSELCGPQRHFHMYRTEIEKRFKLRKTQKDALLILPFLGLVTQELTSLQETTKDFVDGELNFEKITTTHKVVGRFFEALRPDGLQLPTVGPEVLSYAMKLTSTLSEEQLYEQSLKIEGMRIQMTSAVYN